MLYISHREKEVSVLGPGIRYVLWVQGCKKKCPGCLFPEGHAIGKNGYWMSTDEILKELAEIKGVIGITISGGEPFLQSRALSKLIRDLKSRTTLDIMVYSGYTLAELHQKNDMNIEYILQNIDLLVDGEYIEELNNNSIFKGSDNQIIHYLSDKYKGFEETINRTKSRNVEFVYRKDNLFVVGIPEKNFKQKFWTLLNKRFEKEGN